jgi:serine/threonine protein kinase
MRIQLQKFPHHSVCLSMKYVGPYELLKPLAAGGMAEVFLARSTSSFNNGKIVALKRTLPDYLDSPELCDMFLEEIRVGASLNHQNIVQVCDFGQTENQAFLVMEYIHGLPLRELIATLRDKDECLPLPFILYIVKKIAEALEYAYNVQDPTTGDPMQLIHRDISPQNVMITYEGEVKVIDFGIAKAAAVSGNTQHGTVKGKLAYMSPEQIMREPIDNRSDLFSLGIIFWELLANRRFFAGKTPVEVKHMVREYRFHTLDFNENENLRMLEPVLARLLHHDKTKRYTKAKDFGQDLQLILNKSFPNFSPLEFAVYLKNLFYDKYERSMREMKALIVGEHTRTDLINEKTEQTVVTHSQIRVQPTPTYKPLVQAPVQPPPRLVQIRAIRVVKDPEPETRVSASVYMMLLLGFGIFGYFGYHWHSNSTASFSYLANLLKVPASFRGAAVSEYAEITLTSASGPSQVIVNNQLQSAMTPLKLRLLKNRPYQIELSSPGFIPRHFSFIPGRDAQYMVSLEPLPRIMPQRQVASIAAPAVVPKKAHKRPAAKVAKNARKK